ncbi:MAG: hypothetical protein EBV03_09620 [Proteobacteria bacterium]|nr:hypothetical protein [Pseudomonadota bacterium]
MRETYQVKGMTVVVSDEPRAAKKGGFIGSLQEVTTSKRNTDPDSMNVYVWVQPGPTTSNDALDDMQARLDRETKEEMKRANRGVADKNKLVYASADNSRTSGYTALMVPVTRERPDEEVYDRTERLLRNAGIEEARGLADRAYAARNRTPLRGTSGDGLPGH